MLYFSKIQFKVIQTVYIHTVVLEHKENMNKLCTQGIAVGMHRTKAVLRGRKE